MKKFLKNILISTLQAEAKIALKKHHPRIIAITGSVGKTSTKDAIAAALSTTGTVRKSQKSFNSDIGIPLAILGLENPWNNPWRWIQALSRGFFRAVGNDFPETLVLEIGADMPKDISKLSSWLKTDVVVFTQFAEVPVHISNFASRKNMLEEKLSLLNTLNRDGKIVMNSDDTEFTNAIKSKADRIPKLSYGLMPPTPILGSNSQISFDEMGNVTGFSFKIENEGSVFPVEVGGALGDQHIYPSLAGFAVGKALGINPVKILEGLSTLERQPGRMRLLEGVKNTIIIDDSYNSSPIATARALDTLERIPAKGRKIAMIGDMLELGKHSETEHKKAGEHAARTSDILVAVGEYAKQTAEGALFAGMNESNILQFENSTRAGKYVEQMVRPGDLILVKGSQGNLRMERAVLEMMAHPELREKLLVRQEKEWLNR